MVSNPSHRITKAFLYEPGYPRCVEKKAMQKWQIDANAMFSRVFESYYAGDLKAAVEHLIDGSGDQKGYFSSQKTEVKALQISKAHTLHKQLNQQESPAICKESVSKIKTSLIIAYGSNTRTLFKEVAKATIDVSTVAEKMIVLGYGHMLPQESPLVFSEYSQSAILQRS